MFWAMQTPVDAVAAALAPNPMTYTGTPICFNGLRILAVRKPQLSF